MEISFKNYSDCGSKEYVISLKPNDNSLFIEINHYDFNSPISENNFISLERKQITELIGALLHIQSKFKK